ncbi:MAG: NAD(P)H-hydrate epimerase [Candidatus Dormibacteria bacterium]
MRVAASAAEARELDAAAAASGVSTASLMAVASFQVARLADRLLLRDGRRPGRVAVVAGRGNNGADALGSCRHLAAWGHRVQAVVLAEPPGASEVYCEQLRATEAAGVVLAFGLEAVAELLRGADLIIDGLLGTGAHGAPRSDAAAAIAAVNAAPAPVLAIDVPSGLDASDGSRPGECVRSRATVMLGAVKTGCRSVAARPWVGELWLADIGIPSRAYQSVGLRPPLTTGAGLVALTGAESGAAPGATVQ